MGFFSNIVSSAKDLVRKAAPIATAASTFIPALRPLAPAIAIAQKIAGPAPTASPVSSPGVGAVGATARRGLSALNITRSTVPPRVMLPSQFPPEVKQRLGIGQTGGLSPGALVPQDRSILFAPVSAPSRPTRDIDITPRRTMPAGVSVRPAMSTLPAITRAGVGVVRSMTGKFLRVITPEGRSIPRKKLVSMIRQFGVEAAAAAVGISVADALMAVADDAGTRRRRRGITPRDLQTTRRTICKIKNMNKLITGRAPARRTCK